MFDIRDRLFGSLTDDLFTAALTAERDGCLSGAAKAKAVLADLGVNAVFLVADGESVKAGEVIARVQGTPKQIALVEERLPGLLAKYSGVATAAREAVALAKDRGRIVSGSWKKMPPEIKDGLRQAVLDGGAFGRISTTPMLYIDKNYLRVFGSIPAALAAAAQFPDLNCSMQIRGLTDSIDVETGLALKGGCGILMVDTGRVEDLARCVAKSKEMGMRDKVEIAYSGNIRLADIPMLMEDYGPDILCIGKAIMDAPMLDMKLVITGRAAERENAS